MKQQNNRRSHSMCGYESPQVEVLELELEGSILSMSDVGEDSGFGDYSS